MLADEPLAARRLAALAGLPDAAEARRLVERLRALYDADGSAFQVEELAGGYQLLTPARVPPVARPPAAATPRRRSSAPPRARRWPSSPTASRSPAPTSRPIRGVGCGDVLKRLVEKGLVRPAGRDDSLGPADAVRDDEEVPAALRAEEPQGAAARRGPSREVRLRVWSEGGGRGSRRASCAGSAGASPSPLELTLTPQ